MAEPVLSMSRNVCKHPGWWVVAQLALLPVSAWAQETPANADDLFRHGRRELLSGHYESACLLLQRSDELDPAPGTKLNLGECEASRGRLVTAWELFKHVEQQLAPDDPRSPIARSKREALEPRLPRLQLVRADGAPKELRVLVGERELDPTALNAPIPLDPGKVSLLVSSPGLTDQRIEVLLEVGKTVSVTIGSSPRMRRAGSLAPTTHSPSPASGLVAQSIPIAVQRATAGNRQAGSSQAMAGTVVLTVGIVGTALGAFSGIMALDAKRINQENCSSETQSCNQTGRDAAQRGRILGPLTTTALVAGGAGIAAGAYLIVTAQREKGQVTKLSLQHTGNGARVLIERSF